jgi:thimet oligopeptidase
MPLRFRVPSSLIVATLLAPLLFAPAAAQVPPASESVRNAAVLAKGNFVTPAVPTPVQAPFWTGSPSATEFGQREDNGLARAKADIAKMLAVKGARTVANTLQPFDDAQIELDAAGAQAGLIEQVHPDSGVRAAAEAADRRVSAYGTELSLNRDVYDALKAVDPTGADDETRYYLTKLLRDYRLSGVDRDDATRKRIADLRKELVEVGQQFAKNIRSDARFVTVNSAADLAGLPDDYVAKHKPGADGKIKITVDYPDAYPVFDYATNEDLRKNLYMEYNNRGYPMNMAVLDSMIAKRWRLAHLLGFDSWADYITADKMVGSAKNASDFIDRIVEASGPGAKREYETLLRKKQQADATATTIDAWDQGLWTHRVVKADYDFDAQQMRPYFPFDRVKQGVLDVTSKMFGVTYRQVKDAPVWDPSVECWEMLENGQVVGRFYLDMHPRANKYQHAAHFRIRTGVAGRQIPESALICNLPGGVAGDPGLMEQSDAETFFHEFGHLLHAMFAGRHHWVGVGGIRTERDFVEAPSQMLEEWMQDPKVLATFARHYQTNQPVPADLVKKMVRANEFGKALQVRRQMVYARTSLTYYDRDPAQVNTTEVTKQLIGKYQQFPYVEGTHFQTAFGHLDGYSAVYYTYMWSLVIAKDMFSQFDKSDLLNPATAARYRAAVLAPGGTRPAAKLVEDFLGRPFNEQAYRNWLNQEVN